MLGLGLLVCLGVVRAGVGLLDGGADTSAPQPQLAAESRRPSPAARDGVEVRTLQMLVSADGLAVVSGQLRNGGNRPVAMLDLQLRLGCAESGLCPAGLTQRVEVAVAARPGEERSFSTAWAIPGQRVATGTFAPEVRILALR
jgi:hypothetical protein